MELLVAESDSKDKELSILKKRLLQEMNALDLINSKLEKLGDKESEHREVIN